MKARAKSKNSNLIQVGRFGRSCVNGCICWQRKKITFLGRQLRGWMSPQKTRSLCWRRQAQKSLRGWMKLRDCGGQSTIEAAFLLPLVFTFILLLTQPAILLYNRLVMEGAAAEGCRLLITQTSVGDGGYAADKCKGYVERRLGVIPPISIFHLHEEGCSYVIEMEGDENSATVTVKITNKLKLLPLTGEGARLLGLCDVNRIYTQQIEVSLPGRPNWVTGTPDDWAAYWDEEGSS